LCGRRNSTLYTMCVTVRRAATDRLLGIGIVRRADRASICCSARSVPRFSGNIARRIAPSTKILQHRRQFQRLSLFCWAFRCDSVTLRHHHITWAGEPPHRKGHEMLCSRDERTKTSASPLPGRRFRFLDARSVFPPPRHGLDGFGAGAVELGELLFSCSPGRLICCWRLKL